MGDGDPTELAPADSVTESVRAWGLADFEDEPPTRRLITPGRITGVAVATSLVAVTAAGMLAWHLRNQEEPIPAAATSSMVPATTMAVPVAVTPPAPPPPPPVTITTIVERVPAPTTGWAPPGGVPPVDAPGIPKSVAAEYDQQFLTTLRTDGWTITNSAAMVNNAHIVCVAFQRGVSRDAVYNELMTKGDMTPTDAVMFTSTAMQIYPNCP